MLDFPDNPTFGQVYEFAGKSWTWDGAAWVATSPSALENRVTAVEGRVAVTELDIAAINSNLANYYTKVEADARYVRVIPDLPAASDVDVADSIVVYDASTSQHKSAPLSMVVERTPGRRNMLDNASFLVCQRGVSADTPHGTNLAATADRWRIRVEVPSGAPTMEMASAEVAYPGGLGRALRFRTTAGSKPTLAAGDYVIIAQSVEGLAMRQCGLFADPRTIYPSVLSFWAYSTGAAGRYIAELVFGFQAGPNADSISLPFDLPADAWTRVVLPVPGHSFSDDLRTGDTTGASLYLWCAAGSNYSGGSALNDTFTLNPASDTRAVGQFNTLGATGRAIHFADMQWEVGVRPTLFERLSYDDDLYRCYRFFQRFNQSAGAGSNRFYATGMCNSTSAALFYLTTRRRMRTTPTVTVSAANTFQVWHGGSTTTVATIGTSTDSNSPDGVRLGATVSGTPFTAGGGAILRAANGNAFIDLVADL